MKMDMTSMGLTDKEGTDHENRCKYKISITYEENLNIVMLILSCTILYLLYKFSNHSRICYY